MAQRKTRDARRGGPHDLGSVRRNSYRLFGEETLFMFAAGLLDGQTILPAFVTRYSSSLVLIALLPAILSGGRLLPRVFAAHVLRSRSRIKPWLLGSGLASRLPIVTLPLMLIIDPHASATLVLPVLYVSLLLFAVADSFAGVSWYDFVGKAIPAADRPWLFGGMTVGGAVMGLAAGVLVKVMFDSAHRPFPSSYALLFALAFVALAMGWAILAGLREPVANAMPGSGLSATAETEDAVSEAATLRDSLHLLRRLLSDGGPFARLMGVQLLLGVPTLAAGLYTPFALGALRMPTDVTGIFVAATAVGAGVGGLCLPLVARRSGSLAILSVSAAAVVLAPPAFALASVLPAGVWLRAICCSASFACQGVANAGLFMGVNDLVLEMAPAEERTLYIGLSNTVPGLLVPLPVLGGVLAQWVGSAAVLWLCPLPALAGLAVLRNVRERPG